MIVFKDREDVFAIYWQKGSKSVYMPAIEYDPYMYRLHKMRGGTLKDYADKKYSAPNEATPIALNGAIPSTPNIDCESTGLVHLKK